MPIPQFIKELGSRPSGVRMDRIKLSPNFGNSNFENQHHTPQLTEGVTIGKVLWQFLFKKVKDKRPNHPIPSVKTDLNTLPDLDLLVWFGHSSYFLKLAGKTFLVDPVFSGSASPVPGMTKAFEGADIYCAADMPDIDYLVITHDHYDHLDYDTIIKIKGKVRHIICGLGVGSHFVYWGYEPNSIKELDWYEEYLLPDGFTIHGMPARHFSGRTFFRNNTLWMSYVLEWAHSRIYLGGDSGYDTHFAEIGVRFGSFDLAILDCGQYDDNWKYIHMHPPEVVQAATDLNTSAFLAVHSSKFALANHAWYEPLQQVWMIAKNQGVRLITPVIGQALDLKDQSEDYVKWWQ